MRGRRSTSQKRPTVNRDRRRALLAADLVLKLGRLAAVIAAAAELIAGDQGAAIAGALLAGGPGARARSAR